MLALADLESTLGEFLLRTTIDCSTCKPSATTKKVRTVRDAMFSNLRVCFGDDAGSDSLLAIVHTCLSLAGRVVYAPMLPPVCCASGPCSDAWPLMGYGVRLYGALSRHRHVLCVFVLCFLVCSLCVFCVFCVFCALCVL
jgi:hypothetical protein